MNCLQCDKVAKLSEMFDGTEIYLCEDGHRTGVMKDELSNKEADIRATYQRIFGTDAA